MDILFKDKDYKIFDKNKMNYKLFINACRKMNINDLTNFVNNIDDNDLNEYLSIFKNYIDTYNDEYGIVNKLLLAYPKYIFKITDSIKFKTLFPEIKQNININIEDDLKNTFIFHLDITNAILILESDINVNVNHTNCGNSTFVFSLSNVTKKNISDLIKILKKKSYNFNIVNRFNRSIFSLAFNKLDIIYQRDILVVLLEIKELNLFTETTWLKLIINEIDISYTNNTCIHKIFESILKRHDYLTFMLYLIQKYDHMDKEKHLIKLCYFISKIDKNKLNEMLQCIDTNGNTFFHFAAMFHFKDLIGINYPILKENIKENYNGKKPIDLYKENKIKNLLSSK